MRKILKTDWFETVHPMTYWVVAQSVVWGIMILLHLTLDSMDVLNVGDLFWPEPLTYAWAISLIIAGIVTLFFFLRDHHGRGKVRIWISAKVNLALWTFATVVWWMVPGSQVMIIISIMNIVGFAYIGLASRVIKRRTAKI